MKPYREPRVFQRCRIDHSSTTWMPASWQPSLSFQPVSTSIIIPVNRLIALMYCFTTSLNVHQFFLNGECCCLLSHINFFSVRAKDRFLFMHFSCLLFFAAQRAVFISRISFVSSRGGERWLSVHAPPSDRYQWWINFANNRRVHYCICILSVLSKQTSLFMISFCTYCVLCSEMRATRRWWLHSAHMDLAVCCWDAVVTPHCHIRRDGCWLHWCCWIMQPSSTVSGGWLVSTGH